MCNITWPDDSISATGTDGGILTRHQYAGPLMPHLWIDPTYVKVRNAGRIVSVAVTIAVAVNADGRREASGKRVDHQRRLWFPRKGMAIGASAAGTFWVESLRRLKRRGVAG